MSSAKLPHVKFIARTGVRNSMGAAHVPYMDLNRPKTSISPGKKNQLERLLQDENLKAKRERIGTALNHKLTIKFGSKNKAIISFFVEEFLNSHEHIRSEDLVILEKEVKNALAAIPIPSSTAELTSINPENNSQKDSGVKFNKSGPEVAAPPPGSEWKVIQAYQVIQNEEKERQEREKARMKKIMFKKSLDEQLSNSPKSMKTRPPEDQMYAEYVYQDIANFEEEQKRKRAALWKKNSDELEIRKKQIEEQKKLKDFEKSRQRLEDERNTKIADEKFRRETEAALLHKQRELEYRLKMERENEENLKILELEKRKESEEDYRLMQAYAARLDREAAERENAFKKRMETMEKLAHKFESEGAGKSAREERLRAERLLLMEQQKKEAMDAERDRKKFEERRLRQQKAMLENQRQLQYHKQRHEDEKKQGALMKDHFRHEMEEFQRIEQEKRMRYRKSQEQYRSNLDQQVEESKLNDSSLIGFTNVEMDFNMSTFRQITEDPKLLNKVMEKARLSKSAR